jgi:hypothetical protein
MNTEFALMSRAQILDAYIWKEQVWGGTVLGIGLMLLTISIVCAIILYKRRGQKDLFDGLLGTMIVCGILSIPICGVGSFWLLSAKAQALDSLRTHYDINEMFEGNK